jgi:hypothetical protein
MVSSAKKFYFYKYKTLRKANPEKSNRASELPLPGKKR